MRFEGFHGRAGLGQKPALLVVDVNVGFTDPESPLVCDLDGVVAAIQELLREFRAAGFPIVFTTVAFDEAARQAASVFIEKVPALLTLEAGSRWIEIDPRIAPLPEEAVLGQELRVGVLRDAAAEHPQLARLRLRRGHRCVHLGLRPRDRGGRAAAQLPRGGPAGSRR